jgi:hypothetical protein
MVEMTTTPDDLLAEIEWLDGTHLLVRRVTVTYEYRSNDGQIIGEPAIVFQGVLEEITLDGPTAHIKASANPVPRRQSRG